MVNFILIIFKGTLESEEEHNEDEDYPDGINSMVHFTPHISQSVDNERSNPLNNFIKCY